MDTCVICSASPFRVPLSCGCTSFCQECILDWLKVKLETQGMDDESGLVCPAGHSGHEVTVEELLDLAKGTEVEEVIAEMTLKRSLRNLEGMVFCPREHCDYIGWVRPAEKCSYPLVCELCGSGWRDDQLLPAWQRFLQLVTRLCTCQEDSFSLLWKDLWTEACPGCGASIEKNGGCPHMSCFRCKLEFCWTCMRPYRNHDSELCEMRMLVSIVVFFTFGLLLALKLLWICDAIASFFHGLQVLAATVSLWVVGVGAVELAVECRCGFIVLILYGCAHVAAVLYTDIGASAFKVEAGLLIAVLHCALGFTYLKYIR